VVLSGLFQRRTRAELCRGAAWCPSCKANANLVDARSARGRGSTSQYASPVLPHPDCHIATEAGMRKQRRAWYAYLSNWPARRYSVDMMGSGSLHLR
jgi:anti-sigma factor RsiW